jgi:hypothetical protein
MWPASYSEFSCGPPAQKGCRPPDIGLMFSENSCLSWGGKENFALLDVCMGFEPLGVYVKFRKLFTGWDSKKLNRLTMSDN